MEGPDLRIGQSGRDSQQIYLHKLDVYTVK
jgi:hypothetical protein